MARVIDERRERLTFERIEFNDDDFSIAGPVGIDAEKTLSVRSYGSAIGVDVTLALTGANMNRLKVRQRVDCGFGGPTRYVVKPWADHFIAFFNPAFVGDRAGMGMCGGGANVLNGNAGGLADG